MQTSMLTRGFVLQRFQPLRLADIHPAVLRLPGVDRRFAHANLTSQFRHLAPGFVLLQHADNLLFTESTLLYLESPFVFFRRAEILKFIWSRFARAGQMLRDAGLNFLRST